MWFIQALFQISLLYAVIEVLLQKLLHGGDTLIAQGLLSGVLLWVGWHCNQVGWNVWGLGIAASCYWMFYLGTVLRRTARSEVRPLYRAAAGAAAARLGRAGGQRLYQPGVFAVGQHGRLGAGAQRRLPDGFPAPRQRRAWLSGPRHDADCDFAFFEL